MHGLRSKKKGFSRLLASLISETYFMHIEELKTAKKKKISSHIHYDTISFCATYLVY